MRLLTWTLAIKILIIGIWMYAGHVDLAPDEAQYWTWSQQLDWGYYSKPPGIAWQMAATTSLFGNTAFGVRVSALIISTLLALGCYVLARNSGLSEWASGWAGVVFALAPIGIISGSLATTDGGLALCWTAAAAVIAKGIRDQKTPSYLLLGFVIGAGALFKWPAYYLWILVLVLLPFYPFLRSGRIVGGMLISLIALLPSLYWNVHHDWATFRHVWATIIGESSGRSPSSPNPADFLGAQIGLLSPIPFAFWILSFRSWRLKMSKPAQTLLLVTVGVVSLHLGLAFFKKMQGNWCAYIYPLTTVPIAAYVVDAGKKIEWRLFWGLVVAAVVVVAAMAIPTTQQLAGFPSYSLNPWRQAVGWRQLDEALVASGYDPERHFVFSDKYQNASLLAFYGPSQKRTYFFNLHDRRRNQFSYWPTMADEQVGNTGFFVWAENIEREGWKSQHIENYHQQLQPYFDHIEYVGTQPLFQVGDTVVKIAAIFRCEGYRGGVPGAIESY